MIRITTNLEHGGNSANTPKLIVIHAMGEYIKDSQPRHAIKFLDHYGLSAHSLIAPDGTNYRCREDNQRAWHARGFNPNSLGIEFLVPGVHDYGSFIETIKTPYLTDNQYRAGVEQVREWIDLHGITEIARHSDKSPGRKVDPGDGFPWEEFLSDIGMAS